MRKEILAKRILISGVVIACIAVFAALAVVGLNALVPEREFRPLVPHRVLYTVEDTDIPPLLPNPVPEYRVLPGLPKLHLRRLLSAPPSSGRISRYMWIM